MFKAITKMFAHLDNKNEPLIRKVPEKEVPIIDWDGELKFVAGLPLEQREIYFRGFKLCSDLNKVLRSMSKEELEAKITEYQKAFPAL